MHTPALEALLPRAPSGVREAQIYNEQVNSVYMHSPNTTLGSLVVGLVLIIIMWPYVAHAALITWGLVLCAHQALRIYHYSRYRTASDTQRAQPKWGRLYTLAAIAAGLIWGAAGVLMFVPNSVEYQAILLLVLTGNVVVSMLALSSFAPAFFAFAPLTLLPFVVRAYAQPQGEHTYLAVYGSLALVVALLFGRRMNLTIRESLAKRFENLDLIEALQLKTKQLEEQTAVAEAARFEAERANQAKTQFFRAANHDLRQPLHALGMFGRTLAECVKDSGMRGVIDGMNASIRSLEALFNALLDMSKLDAGVIEVNPDHFVLDELFTRLRRDYSPEADGKQLKLCVRSSGLAVYSDPILLERVLRNLVSNAVRYTERGGVVVGCRRRGSHVSIEVWDSGVGIAEHEREQVFEEFYQAGSPARHSSKGLGLGLSTVRRLVQLLGHKLQLESRPGRGSVFKLLVPLGQTPTRAAQPPVETRLSVGGLDGKLVLVIDDEPSIREAMQTMLTGWRCGTAVAENADSALEAIADAGRYPDLIIVDYRLQREETGLQAVKRLRWELGKEIPAILITASTTLEHLAEAESQGYLVMNKPVLPEDLQRVMQRALTAT